MKKYQSPEAVELGHAENVVQGFKTDTGFDELEMVFDKLYPDPSVVDVD